MTPADKESVLAKIASDPVAMADELVRLRTKVALTEQAQAVRDELDDVSTATIARLSAENDSLRAYIKARD